MSDSLWRQFHAKSQQQQQQPKTPKITRSDFLHAVFSFLFMVCILSRISFVNGGTQYQPNGQADNVERTSIHPGEKYDNGYAPMNKSSQNIYHHLLYGSALSSRREKTNAKDLLSTNHRKSIFKRESNQSPLVFANDGVENVADVNTELTLGGKEYASSWAVKIPDSVNISIGNADNLIFQIADELGLINHGNIGHLAGHFLLVHHTFYDHSPHPDEKLIQLRKSITDRLSSHPYIDWVVHETVQKRFKRALEFKDQFFPSQWHLVTIALICFTPFNQNSLKNDVFLKLGLLLNFFCF